jgi:hypothetical protein
MDEVVAKLLELSEESAVLVALYSAKAAGRNCIHMESDQLDRPAASA